MTAPAAATGASTWTVRRVVLVVAAVLLLASLFEFGTSTRMQYVNDWPVDFNLNSVAARRLLDREPLYDRAASRAQGIRTIGEMPNLTATMEKRKWPEARIRKVMGENWLRVLGDVWG